MTKDTTAAAFIADLASASPAPGGGSASALSGSMGAALLEMAVRITRKINEGDGDIPLLQALTPLKDQCFSLIEEDAAAFRKVMDAYGLPKTNDDEKRERSAAIQEALKTATEVPLRTAGLCQEIMTLARQVIPLCKESCVSDAVVGFYCAEAGLEGALANVAINISSLKNEEFKQEVLDRREAIRDWQGKNRELVKAFVAERLKS
jgi:formiminotetrahydrofolate cyclodeaminase